MSTTLSPPGGTVSAELRHHLDALARAARHGTVGGATVLAYVATLRRLACQLAIAEDTLDTLADESREQAEIERATRQHHRAQQAALADALATRKVLPFPSRILPVALPFHDHCGGAA